MAVFKVNRRRWARGGKKGEAMLLNGDGNSCCIGFACRQTGAGSRDIKGRYTPGFLRKPLPGLSRNRGGRIVSLSWVLQAADVNDDRNLTDAEREAKLQKLARSAGHDFEFRN